MNDLITVTLRESFGNCIRITISQFETVRKLLEISKIKIPKNSSAYFFYDDNQLVYDISLAAQGIKNDSEIDLIIQKFFRRNIFHFPKHPNQYVRNSIQQQKQYEALLRESLRIQDLEMFIRDSYSTPGEYNSFINQNLDMEQQQNYLPMASTSFQISPINNSPNVTSSKPQINLSLKPHQISDQPLPTPWEVSLFYSNNYSIPDPLELSSNNSFS